MSTRRIVSLLLIGGWLVGRSEPVRFFKWIEVQPILTGYAIGPDKPPDFADTKEAESWFRLRDIEIRGRVERAVEDSISAMILFGSSFTVLPTLPSASSAINAAGDLLPPARARIDAFLKGIDEQDTERFRLTFDTLRSHRIAEDEVKAYLTGNLRRYGLDQAIEQRTRKNPNDAIPAEASLMTGFAIEEALRNMKSKGSVTNHIRRIAVIGPGFDFGGQGEGFDSLPLQIVQPFAVMEAVLRVGLAQPSEVQITGFDLNPWVLAHGKSIAKSRNYQLQLGHPGVAPWNPAAVNYWQHFGDLIGAPGTALPAPPGVELRSIAIKPQFAARVAMQEINIVTQAFEAGPAAGFDLVVATNVLGYYVPWEQAMALTGMAQMMSSGGILLINNGPSAPKIAEFEPMGTEAIAYNKDGSGDSITVYRRR